MARSQDGYSRLVGWLKIVLPLGALALLSTVFLLSRTQEATQDLPYAEVEVGDDGLVERVLNPTFAGATENGDLIAFVAETARPVGQGLSRLRAMEFSGRVDLTTGSSITFKSDTAFVDQPQDEARLTGSVVIASSTGYRAETEALTTKLPRIRAETDGEVVATGPFGRFTAGKMVVTMIGDGPDVDMVFTDGVKLIYKPRSE